MWLTFDEQGIVTESTATGIFAGRLPAVGQTADLDMQIGDAAGNLDLDFDFTQTGQTYGENLDLDGDMGGDGVTLVQGSPTLTVQDFSLMDGDPSDVLFGTRFTPSTFGPNIPPMLVPDPDGDPFDGFLRLNSPEPFVQNAVAFDNTSPGKFDRITAEFDFRIMDHDPIDGRGDGFSFALLPTAIYGEQGPLEQPNVGAEPNLLGALGVGFDTSNGPEDDCFDCVDDAANHISLHFDGQQVGDSRVIDPQLELDLINGQWNTAVLELQDVGDGALVSLSLIDGTDGSEHQVYQGEYLPGFAFQSARAAFAAGTGGLPGLGSAGMADELDIDNLFVNFSCELCSDFNDDFVVDQSDMAIWHQSYAIDDFADGDGDGDSDGTDFLQLQREYTGGGFLVQSVPEPTTLLLLLVSLSLTVSCRR